MSQDNLEITRRVIALWTGDPEAVAQVLDLIDPDIEVQDYPGMPDREWHGGYEGVAAFAVKMWEVLEDLAITTTEVVEAPDGRLVIQIDGKATGKQSGVRVSASFFSLLTFREGRLLRSAQYATKAEALEAVGLSE